jgi:hypothetical protein
MDNSNRQEPPLSRLRFRFVGFILLAVVGGGWWCARSYRSTQTFVADSATPQLAVAAGQSLAALPREARNASVDNPRAARITFAGVTHIVAPNARGEFSRVIVPASAIITGSVPFLDATPGEEIAVQAEDGGVLLGEAASGALVLDHDRRVPVQFKVSGFEGLNRVTLRRGSETRLLEFWIGDEPAVVAHN